MNTPELSIDGAIATLTLRRPEQANRLGPDDLAVLAGHIATVNAAPEVLVLRAYLPQRLSAEEITQAVGGLVQELGASGPGDMGKVMGAAKSRLAGKADMGLVSAAVKKALTA